MKSVSSLSQSELNNLISEASRELEARRKSEAVIRDIHKVLDKHGIAKRKRSAVLTPQRAAVWHQRERLNAPRNAKGSRLRLSTAAPLAGTLGPDEAERLHG